jgi:phytol kinase
MLIDILISLSAIFILLVVSELLWRKHKLSDELTRKTVHVSVAVFVAFWPYYMSYRQIQLLAIAFLLGVLVSRYLHIFKGILHVKRKTYGDLFFPLSILILAIIQPEAILFTLALLHVGLSDGIAALVGKRAGKKNQYKVFGNTKSVAGTTAFIAISLAILVVAKLFYPHEAVGLSWLNVIILPPILALVENISACGADDLTIPLVLLVGLRWF